MRREEKFDPPSFGKGRDLGVPLASKPQNGNGIRGPFPTAPEKFCPTLPKKFDV
jgi:hypothetical protein